MNKIKKIIVPFSIDDPLVGKIIYPINKVLWFSYIGLLIFLSYLQVINYFKGQLEAINLILIPVLVIPIGLIIFLINGAINEFFYDNIIIEENEFKLVGSKIFGKQSMVFSLGEIASFVWLQRTVKQKYITLHILNDFFILDKDDNRHFLLKDFHIGMSEKIWSKFLKAVEGQTGLAVEKVVETLNSVKP